MAVDPLCDASCFKRIGLGVLRLVRHQLELVHQSAELGQRTSPHLLHRPATMHLHRGFGDADIKCNLFAETPTCNLDHDLPFPWAKGCEALPELRQSPFIFPPGAITRQAQLNGVKEILIAEWLGQELNGAALHRLD